MKKILIEISDHAYSCLQTRVKLGVALEVDKIVAKGTVLDGNYVVVHRDYFEETEEKYRKVCWALSEITRMEGYGYGFDEACDIADAYVSKIKEEGKQNEGDN